jgi:polyisoprenoid-binding protein YceI
VAKSGLLSAAGHEHTVMAPIEVGNIDDSRAAHVSFRVNAARLMVLPEEHQSEVQRSMQERVLESSRFPEISFTSDSVKAVSKDSWLVSGRLMLHDEVKPISVSVHRADSRYIGTVTIKQTDFGIQPISGAGGTVKVKNELKINFTIGTK